MDRRPEGRGHLRRDAEHGADWPTGRRSGRAQGEMKRFFGLVMVNGVTWQPQHHFLLGYVLVAFLGAHVMSMLFEHHGYRQWCGGPSKMAGI